MESASQVRKRLEEGQERLFLLLSGVTEEQFKRRPPPSADDAAPWSIAEIVAHILSTERLWAARIADALANDGAEITPSPPEAHEDGARTGRQVPVPQLIHGLLGSRRQVVKLLETATEADDSLKRNSLRHPRLGQLDLAWMFAKIADHTIEHAGQVEAARQAAGARPFAGSAQP
jgi:uncharacterized damage-inducible protein DinB